MTAAQMGGATVALQLPSKTRMIACVRHLTTCSDHKGAHHFAVIGDQNTVYLSTNAVECLKKGNVLG